MLKHLFKVIWNRKKSNGLIIVEIAIAFMIVFVIALLSIRSYKLYNEPLGFEYQDMWNIRFSGISGRWKPERDQVQLQQLVNILKQQSEIESVQLLRNPTFKNWSWSSSYESDGRHINFLGNFMDDNAPQTFGMTLIKGRWFGVQDKGQNYDPAIVNRLFVERFLADEDPVGLNIAEDQKKDGQPVRELRIVGVFEDFRQIGEIYKLTPYLIKRYDISDGGEISNIEIKVVPGTTNDYEQSLMRLLTSGAPNWEFSITPWKVSRQKALDETLIPLLLGAIVGAFFILLVALGLFGVLWQNVMSRTPEIGLRRAIGATANGIHLQVVSELLIVTLLGIAIALLLLIQLPILGDLSWSLFWSAQFAAMLFMLLLSVSCAYYPGKLATAFSPAEALHYE